MKWIPNFVGLSPECCNLCFYISGFLLFFLQCCLGFICPSTSIWDKSDKRSSNGAYSSLLTLGGFLCEQLTPEVSWDESHPCCLHPAGLCQLEYLTCSALDDFTTPRHLEMKSVPELEGSEPGWEEQSIVPRVVPCGRWWHQCPHCMCSKSGGAAEQFSFLFFWLRRQDLLQDYLCKQLALCTAINTNLETHTEPKGCLWDVDEAEAKEVFMRQWWCQSQAAPLNHDWHSPISPGSATEGAFCIHWEFWWGTLPN